VRKLAAFERGEFVIFGVEELLLADLGIEGFFMVDFGRGAVFWAFIESLAVGPQVDGPGDVFFGGVGVFDEVPELSDIFGHDGEALFVRFSFFHSCL
jgi:hypothetical protein